VRNKHQGGSREGGLLVEKEHWRGGNMLYPVPAVMVSCQRPGERPNIITVAWAGTVCSDPAMVSVSIRKERYSYDIIKESGSFVINLVSRDLTAAMDTCGVRSGRDMDKFKELHLTPQPSQHVEAPGIAECPVNLECRVTRVIPLGTHDMFLAEVVGVSVDRRYMDEKGTFHLNDAGLVAYSHGTYFELGEKIGTFGYSVRKKPEKQFRGKSEKKSGKSPEKQFRGKSEKESGKSPEKQFRAKSEKKSGK
jgi:flavin reductase (DIM6/NTAB) family NADH-FMN oxidoreductase RutF